MVLVAQPMDLTGTIVGDGDQALEVDGVMVQARLGSGLGLGQGRVPGMVMGQEM
ncbi:hypothetical protein Gogos_019380, partial [Gossypium gossypioides]|nr:hypothetical protein [Gossypium gossypioides]